MFIKQCPNKYMYICHYEFSDFLQLVNAGEVRNDLTRKRESQKKNLALKFTGMSFLCTGEKNGLVFLCCPLRGWEVNTAKASNY